MDNLVTFLYCLYPGTLPNFLSADSWLYIVDMNIISVQSDTQILVKMKSEQRLLNQTSSNGNPLRKSSSRVRNTGPRITSHSAPSKTGVEATKIPHQSKI